MAVVRPMMSSQARQASCWAREDCIRVISFGTLPFESVTSCDTFSGRPLCFTVTANTSPSRCSTRALMARAALSSAVAASVYALCPRKSPAGSVPSQKWRAPPF